MEKCPNCRAEFKGEIACYRCGFDYGRTLSCERESATNRQKAIRSLTLGDTDTALRFIEKACFYSNHQQNKRLEAYILLKKMYNG